MALTISERSFGDARKLVVETNGVLMQKATVLTSKKRIMYREINCIVRSSTGLLCIYYGAEHFKIQTSLTNQKHNDAVNRLVERVRATDSALGA